MIVFYFILASSGIPAGGGSSGGSRGSVGIIGPSTRNSPPGGPHQIHPAGAGSHPLMVPPHSTSSGSIPPGNSNHGVQHPPQSHPLNSSANGGGPPTSPYSGAPPPPPSGSGHGHPPTSTSVGSTQSGGGGGNNQNSSPMQSLISVADTILPGNAVSNSPRGSPPTGPAGVAQLSRTPSRGSQHSPSSSGKF